MRVNHIENAHFRNLILSLGLLLGLIILPWCIPSLPKRGIEGILQNAIAQARGRNPFIGQAGNGYYENLMGRNDPEGQINPILRILHGASRSKVASQSIYQDDPYLIYKGRPNLHYPHPEEQPVNAGTFGYTEGPIDTNSFGFFDKDRTLEKSPGTRRIAVLGDSITRGWGVPINERYTSILENQFNAQSAQHFEVLNFAVTAYFTTQVYDISVEQAPRFHPDVYLLPLTVLSGSSDWGSHIAQLVRENRDLKYDFLKELVKEAGLRKDDTAEVSMQKLAPYRETILREIFLHMKANAEQHSAKIVVALIPAVEDVGVTQYRFRPLRNALEGTGIPVVDLTNTFDGYNIESLRVNWHDVHPNALGQRMLADNLYKKLQQQPEAWAAITGIPSDSLDSHPTISSLNKNSPAH